MKYIFSLLTLLLLVPQSALAFAPESVESRVTGSIVIQTESHGEAWYVDPVNGGRYYMKDGPTAYAMMRHFGLGISETDFQKLSLRDETLLSRLRGRIVIRVGYHGEAWYVKPDPSGNIYYLQDGPAAYSMMRYLSTGITNTDLAQISEKALTEPVQPEYAREGEDQGIQYVPLSTRIVPTGWKRQDDNTVVPLFITGTTTVGNDSFVSGGENSTYNRERSSLTSSIVPKFAPIPFSLSKPSTFKLEVNINSATDKGPTFYCYAVGNEFWYRSLAPMNQTLELNLTEAFAHYFDVHFANQPDAKKDFQFRVHCANPSGTTYQDWVDVVVQR